MKKKIFYFPNLYPTATGGLEVYNYYLVNYIRNSEYREKSVVLTDSVISYDGRIVFPAKSGLFRIKRWGLGALSTILYYSFSSIFKWKDIDIVFIPYTSNFTYSVWPFIILKKCFGVDYVVHIHGGGLKKWRPYWLQKYFFLNAKKIAGVSYSIQEEYLKRTKRNDIVYLPPLIPFKKCKINKDELKKKYGIDNFDTIILFVGSIKALKAPNLLLDAFSSIEKKIINNKKIGVVLAGDGILKDELQVKYATNPNILFLGQVSNELIHECYSFADIYVITSWFEGTPISLLEAMYNGLACVGTNVSGINNIINNENGLLIEKNNERQLTEALTLILKDDELKEHLQEASLKFYNSNYSYSMYIELFEKFIS